MITVSSLSGGKSSSFMHKHYDADIALFALICVEDSACSPTDKKLTQLVNDKLQKYCSHQPEFIGTVENDLTLRAVLDLEQLTGKGITWLRGDSFEQCVKNHGGMLPNKFTRYCTTDMKLKPIFEFIRSRTDDVVEMQIGFRYDEQERSERFSTSFKYPYMCNTYGTKMQHWKEVEWRTGSFPMIDNKVTHYHVKKWVESTNLKFPEDSNCVGCYWKPFPQLRMNFQTTPNKMRWFQNMEEQYQATFKKEYSMKQISNMGIQTDFFFGTGSGCSSGFCTD